MKHALQSLIKTPQNNLKLWRVGNNLILQWGVFLFIYQLRRFTFVCCYSTIRIFPLRCIFGVKLENGGTSVCVHVLKRENMCVCVCVCVCVCAHASASARICLSLREDAFLMVYVYVYPFGKTCQYVNVSMKTDVEELVISVCVE